MAGTIFYRERRKVGEQERQPRFRVVAAAEVDVHFSATHLRMQELEVIAQALGATLVPLPKGEEEGGGGHGSHRRGGCSREGAPHS